MSLPHSILFYVEDPGAASYVSRLPDALGKLGVTSQLFASSMATHYLAERGIGAVASTSCVALPDDLDLAVVGTSENPDSPGLELIDRCRKRGIPTVGAVDALANAAYRFRGTGERPLTHAPDWLVVPDIWTRAEYVSLGFSANRICVGGHPHYDQIRAEGLRLASIGRPVLQAKHFPNAAPRLPILLFVAEISSGLNATQFQRSSEYSLHGRGGNHGRTEIVIEEFLDAVTHLNPRPYLVLRLHPKNCIEEFERYLPEFDHVSVGGSPVEMVYVADLVVGMSSMLLMESTLLGRPTLSILPRRCERNWLPTTRTGVTPSATTREELQHLLPSVLLRTAPPDTGSLFPTDSTETIARFLACMIR